MFSYLRGDFDGVALYIIDMSKFRIKMPSNQKLPSRGHSVFKVGSPTRKNESGGSVVSAWWLITNHDEQRPPTFWMPQSELESVENGGGSSSVRNKEPTNENSELRRSICGNGSSAKELHEVGKPRNQRIDSELLIYFPSLSSSFADRRLMSYRPCHKPRAKDGFCGSGVGAFYDITAHIPSIASSLFSAQTF